MQSTKVTSIASAITSAQTACLFAPRVHGVASVRVWDRISRRYGAAEAAAPGDGGDVAHNHDCRWSDRVALIAGFVTTVEAVGIATDERYRLGGRAWTSRTKPSFPPGVGRSLIAIQSEPESSAILAMWVDRYGSERA